MDRDSLVEIEPSLWSAASKLAEAEGRTVTQFVNHALAERLAHADPDAYWAARAARARPGALAEILNKARDEPPREGDELDDDLSRGRRKP